MRKFYTLLIASGLSMSLLAQQKINLSGRAMLDRYNAERTELAKTNADEAQKSPVTSAFVVLNPGASADDIAAKGIEVTTDLGSVIIVNLPLDKAEEVAALGAVKYVEFGETANANMDFARPSALVTETQNGFDFNGNPVKFDGAGVVTGVYDTGLDPNHINFKDADGNLRVKGVWQYTDNGSLNEYITARGITSFTTDNANQTHGTHVAGIMAGSYRGASDFAFLTEPDGTVGGRKDGDMPYYGVSTASDIAIGCGNLGTTSVANGVAKIVEYAETQGQPAVVNISLGLTTGPHDGSTAFSRAMAELGKRAIICIAAGNEGAQPISIVKEFTADNTMLRTSMTGNKADGVADIWTNGPDPVKVTLSLYNRTTKKFTELGSTDIDGFTLNSTNTKFANYFDGTLRIYKGVSNLNNRYQVQLQFSNVRPKSSSSVEYLAITVEGKSGQKIYMYGSANATFARVAGSDFTAGSPDNSVNDMACGENVVCVGSYNSRTYWPVFGDRSKPYAAVYYYKDNVLNGISGYSSYGTTYQGRQLPDICAPGSEIISSYSRFYMEKLSPTDRNNNTTATAKPQGERKTNYWGPMQGTSMATPFVSGVVGLWLQANPNLTHADVAGIMAKTSRKNDLDGAAIRWGNGRIDALSGVKEALRLLDPSGIDGVGADGLPTDDERLIVTVTNGQVEAFVAGEKQLTAELYTIAGQTAAKASASDDTVTLATASLAPGVYILRVSSPNYSSTRRIVIR